MRGKSARPRSRRRRTPRRIWPLVGLTAVGVAVVVVAGRRRKVEWLAPETAPEGEAAHEPAACEETPPVWLAGPSGNLYVRECAEGLAAINREGGNGGAPVLFVHALAGNGGQWALQLDHLRGRRRAVALDLRGHGDSDPADDGDYGVDAFARDVAAVADQLALHRFVLVGHSLGGLVAIRYAGLHPTRVAGLLLADPNGDQSLVPEADIAPLLAAVAADPLAELENYFRQLVVGGDREVASWVLEDLRLTHEEALTAAVAAAARYSPRPDLARYPGPRLSVISDINSLPYSLHNLLPDLPVELMTGTGHWLMMDRPRVFNRILDDFLERVDDSPPTGGD